MRTIVRSYFGSISKLPNEMPTSTPRLSPAMAIETSPLVIAWLSPPFVALADVSTEAYEP